VKENRHKTYFSISYYKKKVKFLEKCNLIYQREHDRLLMKNRELNRKLTQQKTKESK
jgi:hypothetical protein